MRPTPQVRTYNSNSAFTRCVPDQIRPGSGLTYTAQVDEQARHLVLLPPRHDHFCAQIQWFDVHLKHEVELLLCNFVRRRSIVDDTCTVYHYVEAVVEFRQGCLKDITPGGLERYVRGEWVDQSTGTHRSGLGVLFRIDIDG